MDKSKSKFFKSQKKKALAPPVFISEENINKKFLLAVNELLIYLLEQNYVKQYIDKYTLVQEPLSYLSPIYFASAIAFLHYNPDGPNQENFNDNELKNNYYNRLFTSSTNINVNPVVLKIKRKMEFLRYIFLLVKINNGLPT